jgi:hypothetical protein
MHGGRNRRGAQFSTHQRASSPISTRRTAPPVPAAITAVLLTVEEGLEAWSVEVVPENEWPLQGKLQILVPRSQIAALLQQSESAVQP